MWAIKGHISILEATVVVVVIIVEDVNVVDAVVLFLESLFWA